MSKMGRVCHQHWEDSKQPGVPQGTLQETQLASGLMYFLVKSNPRFVLSVPISGESIHPKY